MQIRIVVRSEKCKRTLNDKRYLNLFPIYSILGVIRSIICVFARWAALLFYNKAAEVLLSLPVIEYDERYLCQIAVQYLTLCDRKYLIFTQYF